MVRIGLLNVFAMVAALAAPRVAHYRAEIRSEDGRSYQVRIAVQTAGEEWRKPSHTLDGELLKRITLDRAIPPGSTYDLQYTVPGTGNRARIPLAVPEIATQGTPGSVRIETTLPLGYQIAGDMFPVFARNGSGSYAAELANIPSEVEFEIAASGQADLRQRWITPAILSDSAVILFLVAASLGRLFLRKKAGLWR